MKAYKIYVPSEHYSKLVQEHAFHLGWKWHIDGALVQHEEYKFLFLEGSGIIAIGIDLNFFLEDEAQEITPWAFLQLQSADQDPIEYMEEAEFSDDGKEWFSGAYTGFDGDSYIGDYNEWNHVCKIKPERNQKLERIKAIKEELAKLEAEL